MLIRSSEGVSAALRGQGLGHSVTPESVAFSRRQVLAGAAGATLALASPRSHAASTSTLSAEMRSAYGLRELPSVASAVAGARAPLQATDPRHALTYNNFYEFGLDKADPERHAQAMRLAPWSVRVEGLVQQPKTFDLDDLLKLAPMEERIYRFRCVEGWSMVVPWLGYSLSHVLKAVQPLGSAKYVAFQTTLQPDAMPGLRFGGIDWPYAEGLRLDEAMHPLSMLVFGAYGHRLSPQSGAPMRLIVPWKYGFKSAKSVVTIRLTEQMPATAWQTAAPQEYGFFANVNPEVDHPRWSQRTERPLGGGLFARREPTLMFNGYGEQVASLYAGMDLRRQY